MAGLDFLGAVGKGVMVGADQIRRQESHDATLASQKEAERMRAESLKMQQAQLDMNTESHGLKVDAAKTLQAEVARAERLSTLQNDLVKQYPDANPYQRQKLLVDKGVEANLFRGDELEKAHATREALRNKIGMQAYDAVLAGDIKPLQMILGEQGVAARYSPDKRSIILTTAEGEKPIGVDGLLQMEAMAGARQRAIEAKKAGIEMGKLEAEVDEKVSKAELNRATAAGKSPSTIDANGNVVPNPLYAGGAKKGAAGYDDIKSAEDYAKAVKELLPEGEPIDIPRGFELYTNMRENGVDASGNRLSPGQMATALRDSIRLSGGNGSVAPNISRAGDIALTGEVDGRTYTLDPNYTERQALALKDKDGNAIFTDATMGDLYLQALRNGAVTNPAQFAPAWQLANSPEEFAKAEQAVRSGRAQAGEVQLFKAAQIIARGNLRAQESAPSGYHRASGERDAARAEFSRAFNDKPSVAEQARRDSDAKDAAAREHKEQVVIPERTRKVETRRFVEALGKLRAGGLELLAYGTAIAAIKDAIEAVPELAEQLTPEEMAEVRRLQQAAAKQKQ